MYRADVRQSVHRLQARDQQIDTVRPLRAHDGAVGAGTHVDVTDVLGAEKLRPHTIENANAHRIGMPVAIMLPRAGHRYLGIERLRFFSVDADLRPMMAHLEEVDIAKIPPRKRRPRLVTLGVSGKEGCQTEPVLVEAHEQLERVGILVALDRFCGRNNLEREVTDSQRVPIAHLIRSFTTEAHDGIREFTRYVLCDTLDDNHLVAGDPAP